MKPFLTLLLFFNSALLFAQGQRFTTSGTVEFEKKVNMFAVIQKTISKDNEAFYAPLFDTYKRTKPQFRTLKSTLTFANQKTLFTPVADDVPQSGVFNVTAATQPNITFTDVAAKTFVTRKEVFEENFLLKDSTRKINWKLTSETRDIAGYQCRRANAVILDSIYVVAFYTDKIPVSGGPESFSGLPGMILGVALPHENITWFATKVTDIAVPENTVTPPKKGKVVDNKQLTVTLQGALKSWGSYAKEFLKTFSL